MRLSRRSIAVAAAVLFTLAGTARLEADETTKKLLLVTHSGGFIHNSVGVAEDVLKQIGPKHGFEVTCYRLTNPDDPGNSVTAGGKRTPEQGKEQYSKLFRQATGKTVDEASIGRVNKETLKTFDVVLFFTTGNPMTTEETKDLVEWVKAGGAFCGTHCATDTLYGDAAYGNLIGGYFRGHPNGLQNIKVRVEDANHPAAAGFESGTAYKDEMYIFREAPYDRGRLHIILSIEPAGFEPLLKDKDPRRDLTRKDSDYAISWCREEGKGKVFYTSFGHSREVWQDADRFQKHLIGGLKWATGQASGDATPSGKK